MPNGRLLAADTWPEEDDVETDEALTTLSISSLRRRPPYLSGEAAISAIANSRSTSSRRGLLAAIAVTLYVVEQTRKGC
jgi:hypothetical protein